MKFWQAVLSLSGGSAVAALAAFAGIIWLPRVYEPAAFGFFGIFVAIISLLGGLSTGGYDFAMMLPDSHESARRLGKAALITALGSVSVATGLVAFLTWGPWPYFAEWRGIQWLIPFSLWIEATLFVGQAWKNRLRLYPRLAWVRGVKPAVQVVAAGGLVYLLPKQGLIVAFVLSQLVGLAMLIPRRGWLPLRGPWLEEARRYSDFPRYSLVSQALNQASRYLPYFLIPVFYTEAINGQFAQADRVMMLPMALISMAAGQVFYEQAARSWRKNPALLGRITRSFTWKMLAMITPFTCLVMLFGPEGFAFVMGEAWRPAGQMARWLAPWVAMVFLAVPLSYLVDVRRKLKGMLWVNLGLLVIRGGVLIFFIRWASPLLTITWFGLAGAVLVAAEVLWFLYLGHALPFQGANRDTSQPEPDL